ncbi:MAG: AraC family transcriptional regulator, partial [Gemmiger sp.]|nr:AraC family transcriptional regulator [Gemmiger sp.]
LHKGERPGMVQEYTYSPHIDFYIDKIDRETGYEMHTFHTHPKYEMYYEVEGTRRYLIEDAAYLVNAGSVVLIGENQIHKTGSVGDGGSSRIVVNFGREYLKELAQAFPGVEFVSFLSEAQNHLLSGLTLKQQNRIYGMLQEMLALQGVNQPEAIATRKMLLGTLLLQLKALCAHQQEVGSDTGRVTNHTVDQIQSYIALHYAEKLTLTDIANQFYISPYYLSRLFKKIINLSLIEYINGVRIKAAQDLMEKTGESVAAVAEKTGFLTTAHFRRVFKDATGLSPQQYRQYFKRINNTEPQK